MFGHGAGERRPIEEQQLHPQDGWDAGGLGWCCLPVLRGVLLPSLVESRLHDPPTFRLS